jgi:hypothetical protein
MADGKQIELWKTVVTVGVAMTAAGVSVLLASASHAPNGRLELYGVVLLVGGLTLALLGLAYAFWQQNEWKRPPRLGRGMSCASYPVNYKSDAQLPSHSQELDIGMHLPLKYPIEFLIVCSAPILHYAGQLIAVIPPPDIRPAVCFKRSIDSIVLAFPPLDKSIESPSILRLWVYSDQQIRVCRIKRLNRKYMKSSTKQENPAPSTASEQSLPS